MSHYSMQVARLEYFFHVIEWYWRDIFPDPEFLDVMRDSAKARWYHFSTKMNGFPNAKAYGKKFIEFVLQ